MPLDDVNQPLLAQVRHELRALSRAVAFFDHMALAARLRVLATSSDTDVEDGLGAVVGDEDLGVLLSAVAAQGIDAPVADAREGRAVERASAALLQLGFQLRLRRRLNGKAPKSVSSGVVVCDLGACVVRSGRGALDTLRAEQRGDTHTPRVIISV